jgi:hypothetical protein
MHRKNSTIPSRVYKYALLPPAENTEAVAESYTNARRYYNSLVTIERDRRRRYRELRATMFPAVAALETAENVLATRLKAEQDAVKAIKASTHKRAVSTVDQARITTTKAQLKDLRSALKAERAKCESPEARDILTRLDLIEDAEQRKALMIELKAARAQTEFGRAVAEIDEIAHTAAKALRPTLYWGTYLLVEAAFQAATERPIDPAYDTTPDHCAKGRIGVHFSGGLAIDELATSTLMQISPIPTFRLTTRGTEHARGKAARTTLRFRIGTTPERTPLWAVFPMIMDRPLPADGRIKDAYITRQPRDARIPWQYNLCVVIEAASFERRVPAPAQKGTTSINFGWRKMEDDRLRIAKVSNDETGEQDIRLPAHIVSGFAKCADLDSIIDTQFNVIKASLIAWITEHKKTLPPTFLKAFTNLGRWQSQHRLVELVQYWHEHRLPDDEAIYTQLSNPMPHGENPKTWPHGWLDKYRHLQSWIDNFRQHLLNARQDLYRCEAKRICLTSTKLVIDTFCIASVAKRPEPEEVDEDGQAARTNRVIAAPSILRQEILHAAAKYHCKIQAAPTKNGTRRCNVCGHISTTTIRKLVHACTECGAVWDQDVNNTNNLDDAVASGIVTTLVQPAKMAENGELQPSHTHSFQAARKTIDNLLTTKEKILEP